MEPEKLEPPPIPTATSEPWREHYQVLRVYRKPRKTIKRSPSLVDDVLWGVMCELGMGQRPWPLLLYGPPGTGKTTAAECFMDMVPGMFVNCRVFFDAKDWDFDDVEDWWRRVRDKDTFCTVIDDIGKSKGGCTGFEGGGLQRFLDYRKACHNHAGIYVTNIDGETEAEFLKNLAGYYGATYNSVVSRLTCGTRFRLDGRDRRQDARRGT